MLQENKNKNVVVLFSGGIDCSLVSLLLRKEGYRVHLLHYDHGASISNGLHRIRFQELKNLMGEEIFYYKNCRIEDFFENWLWQI